VISALLSLACLLGPVLDPGARRDPHPLDRPTAVRAPVAATGFQDPSAPAGEILGLLRTVSGRPVADARIRFAADPSGAPPWLPNRTPTPTEGRSQPDGRFRMPVPAAEGCLMVSSGSGLGAVVPRISAGAALPIVLEPLGALECGDGRPFSAEIQVLRSDRSPANFGTASSSADPSGDGRHRLTLPAGRYLLRIRAGESFFECAVRIPAGGTERLGAEARGLRLRLAPGIRAELGRWPGRPAVDADGRTHALAGPDVLLVRTSPAPGVEIRSEGWVDADGSVRWPTPAGTLGEARIGPAVDAAPLSAIAAHTVVDSTAGPRVVAVARIESGDRIPVWLPAEVEGGAEGLRTWVVFEAAGCRPAVRAAGALREPVRMQPAEALEFRLEDADGLPVAFAGVRLESAEHPLLDLSLHADARGIVRLPWHPAAGSIARLRSERHVPLELAFPLPATGPMPVIRLEDGLRIRGSVRLEDETGVEGVVVECRDPSGNLGVAPRTALSDEAGSFDFAGLPDGTYTLFAQANRDGVTWSALLRGVQPGRDTWVIVLRSEDPPSPATRRRGDGR
jgi:hypothetical protein